MKYLVLITVATFIVASVGGSCAQGAPPMASDAAAARATVNAKDKDGETSLTRAARDGSVNRIKDLIAAGADVRARDNDGNTALADAVCANQVECIQVLFQYHADVNVKDNEGRTPLMDAAFLGYVGCLRVLIAAHGNVNARDNNGRTALIWAASNGHADCLASLLAAHADVSARNKDGKTALDMTIEMGHEDCLKQLGGASTQGTKPTSQQQVGSRSYKRAADVPVGKLIAALKSERTDVRNNAAISLGNAKDARAAMPLIAALKRPSVSDIVAALKRREAGVFDPNAIRRQLRMRPADPVYTDDRKMVGCRLAMWPISMARKASNTTVFKGNNFVLDDANRFNFFAGREGDMLRVEAMIVGAKTTGK